MYSLVITESYQKRAKKFFKKHPELLNQYQKIIKILCTNPNHPSLRSHKLSGKLEGLHSISINISYRIIIKFIIQNQQIRPIYIGAHDEVY
ncbi:type II toxin-antitoxin system mRNA interferase toxin, RelE/StbE family [Candidatus Peregrinibacteria bacterium]|nr:type II toxin-antitoxin system mRNA interferase toxin, RelE/StbE family [Candidatus Peregrinibacteria bacterium]